MLLWGRTEGNPGIIPLFSFGYGVDRLLLGFTFKIKIRFFNWPLRLGGLSNNPPQQQALNVGSNFTRHLTMKFFKLLFLTILVSCNSKHETERAINQTDTTKIANNKTIPSEQLNVDTSKTEIIDTFVDSLNIGEKGKGKIELIKFRVYNDIYVIIKFYIKGRYTTKDPETWMVQNNYCYETTALMGFEPNISDFNNDDFNDITFISGTAARGANEVRRLFVYDNQKQELISIVNSEDYPNMLYNKELDCIDAFLVYGGCSTVFLNIQGDSLKEFARVELFDGLTVSTYDRKGKEKIIFKDTANKAGYIRYKNFRPLKEYDD